MPRNPIWVEESPVSMIEGEELSFSIDFQGANSIDSASIAVLVYKNGSGDDYASSVFVSGDSHTSADNILILKKLTAVDGDGDNTYIVVAECDVDGNKQRRKLRIEVLSAKSKS